MARVCCLLGRRVAVLCSCIVSGEASLLLGPECPQMLVFGAVSHPRCKRLFWKALRPCRSGTWPHWAAGCAEGWACVRHHALGGEQSVRFTPKGAFWKQSVPPLVEPGVRGAVRAALGDHLALLVPTESVGRPAVLGACGRPWPAADLPSFLCTCVWGDQATGCAPVPPGDPHAS